MSRQPEALRLADELDSVVGGALCNRAAAELRRLRAECDALRAALKDIMGGEGVPDIPSSMIEKARAALKEAK